MRRDDKGMKMSSGREEVKDTNTLMRGRQMKRGEFKIRDRKAEISPECGGRTHSEMMQGRGSGAASFPSAKENTW